MSRSYNKVACIGRKSGKADKRIDYKAMRTAVRSNLRMAIDYDDMVFPERRREVGDIWDTTKEYKIVNWDYVISRDKVIYHYIPSGNASFNEWRLSAYDVENSHKYIFK